VVRRRFPLLWSTTLLLAMKTRAATRRHLVPKDVPSSDAIDTTLLIVDECSNLLLYMDNLGAACSKNGKYKRDYIRDSIDYPRRGNGT
jgi:hypothetical protein